MQNETADFCRNVAKIIQDSNVITVRDTIYQFITKIPLLQSAGAVYYACRGSDEAYLIVAFSSTIPIPRDLYTARDNLREALHLSKCALLETGQCKGRFECYAYSYLPRIIDTVQPTEIHMVTILAYDCFDIANMICGRVLLEEYYIDAILAGRLMVNLARLVDWLVRQQILVKISAQNLLIDPDTAEVAIIDWSEAKVMKELDQAIICQYYHDIAQIVLDLTCAEHQEHWRYKCPIEPRDNNLYRLFKLLSQIVTFQFDLPSAVDDAVDYISNLREQREYLIPRIVEILSDCDLSVDLPRYELKSRKIVENGGKENG